MTALRKLSISRFGLLLAIALIALAGLVTLGIYLARPQGGDSAQESLDKPVMATQIEFLAEAMQKTAARIAAHPQTVACFETAAVDVCQKQAANLSALNRDATVLFVAETGGARRLLPGSQPSVNETLISNAGGVSTAAASFRLSLSAPVVNAQGKRLGFVIVEQDVPQLQAMFDTLPLPEAAAYAELQQVQEDGSARVLMRRGNQAVKRDNAPRAIALSGTPWRIAVWRNSGRGFEAVAPYVLAWLIASLVIAILVASTILTLRNRVLDNLKVLVKLTNDVRQQKLKPDYAVDLEEFQYALATMVKLGRIMLGKQKEATTQARLDHLSQVHNRRAFEEKQRELFETVKDGWTHSLLILDIDNFKQINDTFGHEAGDQMIVKFGQALKNNLRGSDFIARLGGDEFCVIFPYTPIERARELAERLRENMPESIELIPGVMQKVSWSGGLAEYSARDKQENEALARADAALLEAKRAGRNMTRVSDAA